MFSILVSKFDFVKARYTPDKVVVSGIKTYEAAVKRAKKYAIDCERPPHVLIREDGTSNYTRVDGLREPVRNFYLAGG